MLTAHWVFFPPIVRLRPFVGAPGTCKLSVFRGPGPTTSSAEHAVVDKTPLCSLLCFVEAAAAAVAFLFPIAGIVISVMGMKESKAAGHKNGLGLTGMIISIVAIVWLLMVFAGLSLLAGAADNMMDAANALDQLNQMNH